MRGRFGFLGPRLAGRQLAAWLTASIVFAGCGTTAGTSEPVPVTASRLEPPLLDETSGLAPSQRDSRLWWAHNDSGNPPLLFALDHEGNHRGTVRVAGVGNIDWEDMATFTRDGRAWILLADVGDNQARRDETTLLLLEEPDPAALHPDRETEVRVSVYLPVRFPDGPRDCEAVAVDSRNDSILLVSKRQVPPMVYRLPLTTDPAAAARVPAAVAVGALDRLPQPDPLQRLNPAPAGHLRSQPTSMDLSPDGRTAAVLTYGDVWVYPRSNDEGWADAFRREPLRLPAHGLLQAEALAFSADGRELLVTSEGAHAPLLRYALPARFHPQPSRPAGR